ncbi:GGDEF domain-containing protein [Methylobacterium soli]|uniref:GGDEF domain-containing protein n=1 Tax=Methylobacterium soli TaxID=553447 RepID=A0A6L3SR43_9HYPH|nr:GGDEF domain-containing protein [Methylobacterium soli]KAB1068513.1 GGDEF domain-containing protein [Methylobacterium soli]GJE45844.1 putative signaling protein [Methylobacterium soli]
MLSEHTSEPVSAVPRRKLIDAVILVAALLATTLIALEVDLFANADGRSASEVRIETDEALLLGTLLAIGLLVFSVRRFNEQKREMTLRIAAEVRARKALELALLDPLTGLANRRHFDDIFGAAAARRSQASQHALLLLDLDDFKGINDSYGHPVGDQVLRVVSDRLKVAVKPGDLVSRLGGDEFAVVAFEVGGASQAEALAARLSDSIAQPISIEGQTHRISTSAGFALFPADGLAAPEVFQRADAALYAAKTTKILMNSRKVG